jgi:hypothetical protein
VSPAVSLARLAVGWWLWFAIVTLSASRSLAHVAPSVNDNNRYIKLSLLDDRIRLAYTVFFGEIPGAALRRTIDANRDGRLHSSETETFSAQLMAEVGKRLQVSIDGSSIAVAFSKASFGSNHSSVAGGAFAVDLVAWLCFGDAPVHSLSLRDGFAIARPGETELRLEAGPGIVISKAAIGEQRDWQQGFRFSGPTSALMTQGLQLDFRVSAAAPVHRDRGCAAPASARSRRGVIAGFGVAGMAIVAAWLWRRHRRESAALR